MKNTKLEKKLIRAIEKIHDIIMSPSRRSEQRILKICNKIDHEIAYPWTGPCSSGKALKK